MRKKRQTVMSLLSHAIPIYKYDLNVIITVPADALAPFSARPSAATVGTEKSDTPSVKFLWLSAILYTHYGPNDIIQNDPTRSSEILCHCGCEGQRWFRILSPRLAGSHACNLNHDQARGTATACLDWHIRGEEWSSHLTGLSTGIMLWILMAWYKVSFMLPLIV